MKDDESIPVSTPTTHSSSNTISTYSKNSTSDATIFGRGRYKFWALAAILLLAFWSMFTGTVTLRWSAGNLNGLSDYFNLPLSDDLDVIVRLLCPILLLFVNYVIHYYSILTMFFNAVKGVKNIYTIMSLNS